MQRRSSLRPGLALALTLTLAGVMVYQMDLVGHMAYAFEKGKLRADFDHLSTIKASDIAALEQLSHGFSVVADAVRPSVVNIQADAVNRRLSRQMKEMFGEDAIPHPSRGTGSGVVLDEDGNILTNKHVIEDATTIRVGLADGRRVHARVVGTDPKTDLAVIKIDADKLHPARFGDSDEAKVGHIVLAIGSPFRLDHTVSHGIISALQRHDVINEQDFEYQGFLQTDAPINPGNSGGPLINVRGEVIGINTAIATESGGNQGVGFAIPSNVARHVAAMLKTGKLVRGYLGVAIRDLSDILASTYGLADDTRGVLIIGVNDDGPAAKAGLKKDDIVLDVDGKAVASTGSLQQVIAQVTPGDDVKMNIWRDGKRQMLDVRVEAQPEGFTTKPSVRPRRPTRQEPSRRNDSEGEGDDEEMKPIVEGPFSALGFEAETVSPKLAKKFDLDKKLVNGVVVTRVDPMSDVYDAGMRAGLVIDNANGKRVANINDLQDQLTREALRKGVRIWVTNGDNSFPMVLQKK